MMRILLTVMLLCPTHALAGIIHVPKDHDTIQGAINVASKGDEIIVAPGVYEEHINFFGQAIAVRSSGGREVTTIDGGGNGSVVIFAGGEDAGSILDGFLLTNGDTGIDIFNVSAPAVTNCRIEGMGNGIKLFDNSGLTISWSEIANNSRGMRAQGSSATVWNCVFRSNGDAEAIWATGDQVLTVDRSVFVDNSGRAVSQIGGSLVVSNTSFFGNTPSASGGAIAKSQGSMSVRNCQFIQNATSTSGGAIHLSGSLTTGIVASSLFIQNTSPTAGGAIFSSGAGALSILNCSFLFNGASNGGGVWTEDVVVIANSIFWLNTPNQVVDWQGDNVEINYSDIHGGWDGSGEGNINAYPMFVDMAGGNLRLLADSPCIDMGNNANVPIDLFVDLDGNERIVDGNEDGDVVVDMGAYEYQGYPACAEDMDGNGGISAPDLAILLGAWGFNPGHPADLDHDGFVRAPDLALLLAMWGDCG